MSSILVADDTLAGFINDHNRFRRNSLMTALEQFEIFDDVIEHSSRYDLRPYKSIISNVTNYFCKIFCDLKSEKE